MQYAVHLMQLGSPLSPETVRRRRFAICHLLSWLQDLMQSQVLLQGHTIVFCNRTPPAALICLLGPLRSILLSAVQPVVLVTHGSPVGHDWQHIARWA